MKLVRDKIPEIIQKSGKTAVIRPAAKDEIPYLLLSKLIEELHEFTLKPSAEEAADIYEVLTSLCAYHNIEIENVHAAALQKKIRRGGFEKYLILESVED